MFKLRPWMVAVAGAGWTSLTLYLLWLCTNASVFVGEDSFLRLMAGPGYLRPSSSKACLPRNVKRAWTSCARTSSTR